MRAWVVNYVDESGSCEPLEMELMVRTVLAGVNRGRDHLHLLDQEEDGDYEAPAFTDVLYENLVCFDTGAALSR